jgi:hypothetical protein
MYLKKTIIVKIFLEYTQNKKRTNYLSFLFFFNI